MDVAHQAPLSMGFSRQEYWSWLSFPTPGDLPDTGIKPTSLMSLTLAGGFITSTTWDAQSRSDFVLESSPYYSVSGQKSDGN